MPQTGFLESFDEVGPSDTGPSPEWRLGHAAGVAEAQAAAQADQAALSATLVQRFDDIDFAYAEAQAHVLGALRPLFDALCEQLLPGLEDTTAALHLRQLLEQAAKRDMAAPLELRIAETQVPVITALLADRDGLQLTIVADPALGPGEVLLRTPETETALDVSAMIDGARAALAAYFDATDERSNHG